MIRTFVTFTAMVFVCVALNFSGTKAFAGDVRKFNLEEITAKSHTIFEGKCIASRVERDAKTGLIVTVATFEVTDSLKGDNPQQREIRQYGGIFPNGDGVLVAGLPRYSPGAHSILFLHKPSPKGLTSPVGMMQGKFDVAARADGTGYQVVNGLGNLGLYRGMESDRLVRHDPKGKVLKEDAGIPRVMTRDTGKGVDRDDFKALVRRLVANPSSSDVSAPAQSGRVQVKGVAK